MRSTIPYISVRLDNATIAEGQAILRGIPKGWQRAAQYALKRTANTAKTSLSRIMRSRMGGKISDIKNLIYVHYPSFANLIAKLEVSEMGRQLIKLGAVQDEAGVSYQPSFGGRRQHIRHAFIAEGASRGRQVWLRARYRIGRAKMIDWNGKHMEAIYLMKEPGIHRFLKSEDIKQIQNEGDVNLMKNLSHGIRVQLNRWNKK